MVEPLKPGIFETLISEALEAQLAQMGERLTVRRDPPLAAELPDRLALLCGQLIRRSLAGLGEKDRPTVGVAWIRELIGVLARHAEREDLMEDAPLKPAELLTAIVGSKPDGTPADLARPATPLLDTTLLTNARDGGRIAHHIDSEIPSADRIDLIMAFIRRSGLRPIESALKRHCEAGRPLRVLTTTYTGSTELSAVEALQRLGAEVMVSYDTRSTRLHAKAWLFHRLSGYSTAYVGSSNLTHSAQITGLEWNVRLSGVRNPDVVDKVRAVFDTHWCSGDFVPFCPGEFRERVADGRKATFEVQLSPVELRPEPFQVALLQLLEASREQGHHKNLLVAATGTGKTVMAAIDYAALARTLPRARLLFVAHRKEILQQSLATFRHALRRLDFGELWVDGARPVHNQHVFASIQTLHRLDLQDFAADHFDIVIIDEFHHAAADSYRRLIEHLQPKELLGLTATPERADGLPLLDWFGGRIAAELRLWDAIERQYLTPFAYFGMHDGIDLRQVPWKRGVGYEAEALTNVLTAGGVWARRVLQQVVLKVDDPSKMRALGFCVSVSHARHMADVFAAGGLAARAIWGDTPAGERSAALADLQRGAIAALFSVDLFNEGVDLPDVDTLLLLRPTDSPVLFLQQLGRGLRRAAGKHLCTVLDFVGHHRREFRFDRRFRSLLPGSRKELVEQIGSGFPLLPAGCHMELDPVAADLVLQNIKAATPSVWKTKVMELRDLADQGVVSLGAYLDHTLQDIEDVYASNRSWSELCEEAGVDTAAWGPEEVALRRACGRLLHVDDSERIGAIDRWVASPVPPEPEAVSERERRMLRMFVASMVHKAGREVLPKGASLHAGLHLLWQHPQVLAELRDLCAVLRRGIHRKHPRLSGHPNVPLRVHGRYSRIEIQAAFGVGDGARVGAWQTGVQWVAGEAADLLAFTLDKSHGSFSPTTRYRDYAISPELIHWESQSVTRADSDTGRRYRQHAAEGSSVVLFARERRGERAFWCLGPATYVAHEGERPMAVTWRLEHALPPDLFGAFAAAVA